jgi:hypothetical protein
MHCAISLTNQKQSVVSGREFAICCAHRLCSLAYCFSHCALDFQPTHPIVIVTLAISWAPEGKRRRGRPKTTWRKTVEKERREDGWGSWDEVRAVAADRERWRSYVKALCATRNEEDR